MPEPVISLDNVSLTLASRAGPVEILKSVDIDITPGEAVAIVGPSGSGKTSLLMIMAGLERATSGAVRVAGHDFGRLGEDALALIRGRNIGIVFQSFHLVPTMTALENVALPLEFAGQADAFDVARGLLGEVGIAHRADHFPAQLSGGEQQRVALARALSPRPQILLADEPTGNLDGKTGEQVIELLFSLQRRRQATLVLITHDLQLARRCGRTIRMADGCVAGAEARLGMTVALSRVDPRPFFAGLPLIVRLVLREQRNGLKGFYVFIACVALGVAVITGVGALADALRTSFERQGEALLGGDVTLARPHKAAEGPERDWLWKQGRISEVATMRAMARRPDGSEQALVEVKGVDAAYPLVGSVALSDGVDFTDAIRRQSGAAIDRILLDRLGLKVGDQLSLGKMLVPIRATIEAEPDKLTDRLTVGPRVFVSLETLRSTGLIEPGSLVTWRYALKLDGDAARSDRGLVNFTQSAKQALPEGGFTIRDRRDPSPQVSRTLERLRQFLTLVGLTALLVGGVGVANAVATYIDRRRKVIAVFKSLGATSSVIFGVHLVQVLLITAIGIIAGMALGFLIPIALTTMLGDALPIKADLTVSVRSLLTAAAYGLLVSLVFTLWPLGRAEQVRAGVLFRDEVAPESIWPRARIIALTVVAALLLVGLAVFSSEARMLAFYYCLGVVGVFLVFHGLGTAITWGARRVRRPRLPELALAIGNLGAPGGIARSVVLSLGAGLSLLVTVALIDRSIVYELTNSLPGTSPNYFVLDIKRTEADDFRALVLREAPAAKISEAPMLRGRLVKLGDRLAEQVKAAPEVAWVLTGDRGLSYAETVPEGSTVVAGQWWPPNYDGEPLVSFEAAIAKGLGLKIGDTVTVNVLGRNVAARIANLREVKWETLSLNFVLVFSPNTLIGAPHNLLATVTLPKDAPLAAEARLAQQIGREFPATTAIRVKDAIDAFGAIFNRVMVAVRAAGSVTLVAGALVLAGALATAQRRRIQQAVILKTLGATRRRILLSHFAEYLVLALLTSFIALLIGGLAAWITVSRVMDVDFVFSGRAAAEAMLLATALVALFGGFGTWRVLSAPPVPYLRSE